MRDPRRVRILCVKEDEGEWYPWYAMSEADWEGGGVEWGTTPKNQETRELWINIDPDAINASCNTPNVKGTVD